MMGSTGLEGGKNGFTVGQYKGGKMVIGINEEKVSGDKRIPCIVGRVGGVGNIAPGKVGGVGELGGNANGNDTIASSWTSGALNRIYSLLAYKKICIELECLHNHALNNRLVFFRSFSYLINGEYAQEV
jgi:hypothetical protein